MDARSENELVFDDSGIALCGIVVMVKQATELPGATSCPLR